MCNSFEKICIPLKICEDYFLLHKFFINCCITEDFNVLCVKKQGQILPQTDIEFPQMLCSANTSSPLSLPHQHGQNYPQTESRSLPPSPNPKAALSPYPCPTSIGIVWGGGTSETWIKVKTYHGSEYEHQYRHQNNQGKH